MNKILKTLMLCSTVLFSTNTISVAEECKGKCTEVVECPKPAPGHADCSTGTTEALCDAITISTCDTGEYNRCDSTTEDACTEADAPRPGFPAPKGPCGTDASNVSYCDWHASSGVCVLVGDGVPSECVNSGYCEAEGK